MPPTPRQHLDEVGVRPAISTPFTSSSSSLYSLHWAEAKVQSRLPNQESLVNVL